MRLADPPKAAKRAGLRYVSDGEPGIRRVRRGRGFAYVAGDGRPVAERVVRRIEALAIPPAWERVWICPDARGHVQATGVDERGRKQYRYHPEWMEQRNLAKFGTMAEFGRALPGVRRRVAADLRRKGLPRERVVAAVVRLLDQAMIRIGNDEYARSNDSYGLTTIRNDHARVSGSAVRLRFKAKSGRACDTVIEDPLTARVIRGCQDLPGQELFEYVGEGGESCDVGSADVNEYLAEITGRAFTAKDFRTWGGTVVAAEALMGMGPPVGEDGGELSKRELKKREVAAVKAAAEALCNTPATCRKYYVHPELAGAYADGRLGRAFEEAGRGTRPRGLSGAERAVLVLLGGLEGGGRNGGRAQVRPRASRHSLRKSGVSGGGGGGAGSQR